MGTIEPVTPKHKLDELILPESVLERLHAIKEEYESEDWLDRFGNGLKPRNRWLFTGPPGNGKTACAHGFAKYMGRKILCVNFGEMLSSYANQSAQNLSQAFQRVRGQKVVLFMDECDAMFQARTQGQGSADLDANRTANVALLELDKLDPATIFIGATNLDGNLDRAIMRRLGGEGIYFPPPSPDQRARFIEKIIAPMRVFQVKANADEARDVSAASFAEIAEQVNEVARRLIIKKRKEFDGQKESGGEKVGRTAGAQENPQASRQETAGQKGGSRKAGQQEKGGAKAPRDQGADRGGRGGARRGEGSQGGRGNDKRGRGARG